ncbi:MAG TPA: branched-chain amino acid ABC transporter permease, partial [Actinomycetota bacterium]|nr:branched-chain amino acid ABC transporter permease [Actinomycetota bacterium]
DRAYLYLCLIALAVILLIDWRLMKTKAGRAILAIRHDERVASTMGVNVTFYKTFAFMLSGFIAGVAGSLFAHWQTVVVSNDFVIDVALTWVFMTVVGGLGSRAGVVIGSAFFALFPFLFETLLPASLAERFTRAVPLIGAVLLVLTLTLYPGGIGQQLLPIRRWLAGGPFHAPGGKKRHRKAKTSVPAGASATADTAEAAASELAEPPPTGEAAGAGVEITEEPGRPEASATVPGGDGPAVPAATEEMPLPPALAEGDGETPAQGEPPAEAAAEAKPRASKPRKRAASRKKTPKERG